MTCKVTVTGENKDRFKSLSQKFGQRAALESLLEAEPNIEIDGFLSEVEIANRVNALTYFVLNSLVENGGNTHILDLENKTFEARYFSKALDAAKQKLESIISNSLILGDKGENVSENNYKATRAFITLENFEALVPKIKDRLKTYSLSASERNNDIDDILIDEENDEIKERIYAMSAIERNRLDSINADIKLYISTLSKKVKDIDGNIIEVIDDLGMKVPVDFIDIYSVLVKNLSNTFSVEDMKSKLQELGQDNPNIDDIYQDLENGTMESDKVGIELFGKTVKSFENAFFAAFSNTFHRGITVTTETNKDRETGNIEITSNVVEANSSSLDKTLFNKWVQNNSLLDKMPLSAKQGLWNGPLSKLYNSKKGKDLLKQQKELDSTNLVVLAGVKEMLRHLGINASIKGLSALRKTMNRYDKGSFSKFVTEGAGSIPNMAEKFWNLGGNIFTAESSNIRKIAEAEASVSSDIATDSYMNGKGNQIYPFNLPTAASELINEFKQMGERLVQFANDPFTSNFKIIKDFQKPNSMDLGILDTYYNNDLNEGMSFDELDPTSAIVTRFKLFQNYRTKNKADKTYGWFLVPTPSDRSGSSVFKMAKLDLTRATFDGILVNSEYTSWAKGVVLGELARINKVREEFNSQPDKSKLIVNYHYTTKKNEDGTTSIVLGNGGYFNYYQELNQFLVEDENGELSIDADSVEFNSVLRESLTSQFKDELRYFEKVGVINPMLKNARGESIFTDLQITKRVKTMVGKDFEEGNLLKFIANNIVATHELSTILNGDLAFFKPFNTESGNQTSQFSNANKRAGLAYTPGTKLHVSDNGARESFRAAFINDAEFSSDLFESYSKSIGDKANKYKKVSVTDGQGLCSLDRYAEVLAGQGLLTPEMAKTINELKKDSPNWENVTEPLQPIKGFYQGMRYDSVFGRIMPKNLKYSLVPLIPSNIKNNPTLQKLHSQMQSERVDEAVFVTAAKFGAYNINNLSSDSPLSYVEMSNRDWRVPQIVPYKTKTEENFGTQVRKLIMGNLEVDSKYGDKTGAELQANYHKAISKKLENSLKDLYREFIEEGKFSIRKVSRKVVADLSKNSFKSTSDFITKGLEVVTLPDGTVDTRIPMSFPAIKHRVESSLNSILRKAVTKQHLPGFSAVQYTALGFGKESIQVSKELKFVRLSEDGTTVLPAEVMMSPQYFVYTLMKKLEKEQKSVNPDSALIKSMLDTIDSFKSGEFNIDSLPDSLREAVIYRIPTQGKNSMLPIKIVGFTLTSFGSTIVVPAEMTTQAGIDYDIDKVYIEMKHFEFDIDKKEIRDTTKIKEGVSELFKSNAELSVIGTKQQYSQYLDTIFPDSKMKDIVYHVGSNPSIEKFDKNLIGTGEGTSALGKGFYFGDNLIEQAIQVGYEEAARESIQFNDILDAPWLSALLHIRNPYMETGDIRYKASGNIKDIITVEDGIISDGEYTVFKPEQIHILGSKQDIKGFKEFVRKHGIASNFTVVEDSIDTTEGIDNTIVNTHYSVLTSPIHFNELITPNNSDTLLRLMSEIAPIYETKTQGQKWSSLSTQDDFREKNQAGGIFIGIASLANTAHALLGELGTTLSIPLTVNGKEVATLGEKFNSLGTLISDDHAEIQTAAVDNASTPILGHLNINHITGPSYMFLVEAGAGLPYSTKLINTPIIKDLINRTRANEAIMGKEGAFQSALKNVAEILNIEDKALSTDSDISEAILDEVLSQARKGNMKSSYDTSILKSFLTFRRYGNDLKAVTDALKTDNNGAKQTLAANIIDREKLAKVKGTYSNDIRQKQYPNDVLETVETIVLDREKYKTHSIQSYEIYGLLGAIDLVSKFVEDSKPVFTKLIKDFQQAIGGSLIEGDLRLLMSDFYTYMYTNSKAKFDKEGSALGVSSPDEIAYLFVGKDSVGKRLLRLQNQELYDYSEDVTQIPNQFVQNLTVQLNDKKTGYDIVTFNNSISKALTSEQKTVLSSEFYKMFSSPNEKIVDLAQDLFRYNIYSEGFGRGISSFSDLIPVQLYEMVTDENGENLVDYFRNTRKDFTNIQSFNLDDFMLKFLQNRALKLKGIKNLSKLNQTALKSYLSSAPKVQYFVTNINGNPTLAQRTGESSYTGVFNLNSIPKNMVEYQSGDTISSSSEFVKSKLNGDIVDNNQCAI